MKLTISLQQAPGYYHLIEVDSKLIEEATILKYRGEYYTYASMDRERFFKDIKFIKVKAPVEIPDQDDSDDGDDT